MRAPNGLAILGWLAAGLLWLGPCWAGTINKCVDAEGRVSYVDHPCIGAKDVTGARSARRFASEHPDDVRRRNVTEDRSEFRLRLLAALRERCGQGDPRACTLHRCIAEDDKVRQCLQRLAPNSGDGWFELSRASRGDGRSAVLVWCTDVQHRSGVDETAVITRDAGGRWSHDLAGKAERYPDLGYAAMSACSVKRNLAPRAGPRSKM